MKRLPAVLVFLLLFLSFFAGTASAFMGDTLQNRVGDFFAPPCDCTGWNDPQSQAVCPENQLYVYELATGVVFYVVQNPWTKFDPLGLQMSAQGVATSFGMGRHAMQMPEANRLAQQSGTSLAAQQYRMSGSHVIDQMGKDMARGYVGGLAVVTTLGPGPEDAAIAGLAKTKIGQAVVKRAQGLASKVSKFAEETVQTSIEKTAKKIADESVDLQLKMKEGWTPAQRAEAKSKAQALTDADTTVVSNPQRSSNLRGRFQKAGGEVGPTQDVDHTVDLQLGGADDILTNTQALDRSVNRSMGSQINHKVKDLPEGTKVDKVDIDD